MRFSEWRNGFFWHCTGFGHLRGFQYLKATVPTLQPGPIRVAVKNPDGYQYALDDAYTVNRARLYRSITAHPIY